MNTIKTVLVAGAGTMGRQISLQCALHGFSVHLYDVSADVLRQAEGQIQAYATQLEAQNRWSRPEVEAAVARIQLTPDPEQAAQADLLSESIPEDPQLKARFYAQFGALCPPHTIFTTNTSSLLPSMFAKATGRPDRFCALHFHTYVWDSNVVDIMPHPGTAQEVVRQVEAFSCQIGQIPILLQKESYGYVFNAMLNALNRAAMTLAANDVASVEDVDRAWMGVMKTAIGPFGILDVVGLDTAHSITRYWADVLNDPQLKTNAAFLERYLEDGRLGVKSGSGFYNYPNPVYAQASFLEQGGNLAANRGTPPESS